MYEELIEKLRCCVEQIRCGDCRYVNDCDGDRMLMSQAADAIEELNYKYKKALDDLVKQGKPQWISVKDRLPEENGNYLVAVNCPRGKWDEICAFDGRDWVSVDEHEEYATKWVTYWMPLPAPPKEEI